MPKLDENYNPISSYMSEADTQALSDADKSKYLSTLWSNYCISSHFEPGSTAKPFTTATGLETGKIKPTDKYECNGYLQVGDTYIRCVHVAGDGILDPGGAIERSCNVALMQETVESRGKRFVFSVAPNKNTLFPERMPYYELPGDGASNYEEYKANGFKVKPLGDCHCELYDRPEGFSSVPLMCKR